MSSFVANRSQGTSPALPVLIGLLISVSMPVQAQGLSETQVEEQAGEIIVTAQRLPGSVVTETPPVAVYDELAVTSTGAASVSELLETLAPQTRSGGRGAGGRPVTLLNGRRVSGFAELRDLPPEAIRQIEIFPEEVAIRYGFSPEQRVVNFILKPGFSAITVDGEYRFPEKRGRSEYEAGAALFRATEKGRINLKAEWTMATPLLESARDIIQPDGSEAFRTLLPRTEEWTLNGVYNRDLGNGTGLTANASHTDAQARAQFGLPNGVIAADGSALLRDAQTTASHVGLTLDRPLGAWFATFNGALDQTRRRVLTDNDPAVSLERNSGRSTAFTGEAVMTLRGTVTDLPAGPLSATIKAGYERDQLKSRNQRLGVVTSGRVARDDWNGRISVDLPLASAKRGVLEPLGEVSINANYGRQELSDFGGLTQYGYGLNWTPVKGLTFSANFKAEDAAPSPAELGEPRIALPNVTVFDFARGETALVTVISGGNPLLQADEQRDWKFGVNWSIPRVEDLRLDASYNRIRSTNPVSDFPALTTQTELAFPGRLVRDATGKLISVDQSAVNLAATKTDSLRWGLSYSKRFGQPPEGPRGGRGAGGPPGMPGGGQGGRWNVSLYHTVKFKDEVLLAAGIPALDLLNGDTSGSLGGSPRHRIELEGGWFHKGFGVRVNGNWEAATRVTGTVLPSGGQASDLFFSDRTSMDMRLFYNFSQNKALSERHPFLKGFRIAFQVRNLFDDAVTVRDATGSTPFRYQRGYLEPLGRNFEIDLRKQF